MGLAASTVACVAGPSGRQPPCLWVRPLPASTLLGPKTGPNKKAGDEQLKTATVTTSVPWKQPLGSLACPSHPAARVRPTGDLRTSPGDRLQSLSRVGCSSGEKAFFPSICLCDPRVADAGPCVCICTLAVTPSCPQGSPPHSRVPLPLAARSVLPKALRLAGTPLL